MKNEIVLFTDGDINLEVELSPELEAVWLTQKQMEELFDVKHATVSEHISNILSSGELDGTSVGFSDKSSGGRILLNYVKDKRNKLLLNVYQKNARAISFYKREGFEIQHSGLDEATGEKDYVMTWQHK